jgi:flagellar biosynthesis protein FliP
VIIALKQFRFALLFAFLLLMVAGTGHAYGQVNSSAPLVDTAGPPSPAAQDRARLDQVHDLARQMGMPADAGTATVDHSHDVALPDMARLVPTTTEPQKLSSSLQIVILLSILTLAPSILLMTTCFTRVIIVMSLLRQAIGANGLPPNQVLIGLSLFITFLVMGPTWARIHAEAIEPYQNNKISQTEAFSRGTGVLREFMIRQVVAAHNEDDVYLFYSYGRKDAAPPQRWEDVGTTTLIPAFVLSELKVAFMMGFRIYLPFLIIDMVIASVLISMGMQLLPPAMISLPFKLLLFVLVDGWHLVSGTLLNSFN